MDRLSDVFRQPDALEALDEFIAVFMRFWHSDREVRRGLGAFAVLDPEFAAVLENRSGWRRKGLRVLLERLVQQTGRPKPKEMNKALDLLYMLTGFHTYDSLAATRSTEEVAKMVQRLTRQALA